MPTKPGSRLDWTDGEPEKVEEPSSLKKETGWESAEKPPFQWFNWLFWLQDKWNDYFEAKTDETAAALATTNSTVSGLGSSLSGLSGTVSGHTTALTALSAADTAHDTAIAGKLTAPSSPASGNAIVDDGSGGSTSITKAAFLKLAAGFTALGDLVYGGASGTPALLPGSTSTIKKVLTQTGNGTVSAAPVWEDFAGLSGVGSVNDITNGDFELTVNGVTPAGWNAYADAAAAAPVDGTGGSPNAAVTFLVSTASPIRGTRSAVFTKDAANRQGTGRSFDFAIAGPDRGLVHQLYMEIDTSTNYVAGDLVAYIWDVTNSVLIPTSTVAIPKLTNGKWLVTFTATQSLAYRLIFHIATTNALLWTVKLDSLLINAEKFGYSSAPTPWQAYTPTGSWTTNVTYAGKKRQVGTSMEYDIVVSLTGAPNAATGLIINQPSGETMVLGGATSGIVGFGNARDAGVNSYPIFVQPLTTTTLRIAYFGQTGTTTGSPIGDNVFVSDALPFSFNTGDQVLIRYSVEISELQGTIGLNVGPSAQPEYAYNSDVSATATVTASGFQTGKLGIPFNANWVVGTTYIRRVRFSSPIQQDDILQLEVQEFSGGAWVPYESRLASALRLGGVSYGPVVLPVAGSPTDADIYFGNGGYVSSGGTYGSNGVGFSSLTSMSWRLRKVNAQSPVGFGPASETDSGLILPTTQTIGGDKIFLGKTTLGPATGLVASGPAYHKSFGPIYGSANPSASVLARRGWNVNPDGFNIAANVYQDSASAIKGIESVVGSTQLAIARGVAANDTVFLILANYQDAQTADSALVTTNRQTIFSQTAAGSVIFGPTGFTGTHIANGNIAIAGATSASLNINATGTSTSNIFWQRGGVNKWVMYNDGNTDIIVFAIAGGSSLFTGSAAGVLTLGASSSVILGINTAFATTVGAAGGGSALPATPLGYMRISVNGVTRKIPYYND